MSDSSSKRINPLEHFQNIAARYEGTAAGATRVIARHLAELSSPIPANSKILDNACGTGIVIDEVLATVNDDAVRDTLLIEAVDASSAMVDLLRHKSETVWKLPPEHIHASVLPAEDLDPLPSDNFDYAYTNFGFQFFKDPDKAASHIHRILKPGGRALITSWADLGYMKGAESAGEELRPGRGKPKLPFGDEWYEASHLDNIFRKAGFKEVEVHQKDSTYTGSSIEDIAHKIGELIGAALKMQGWSDEEMAKFPEALKRAFEGYTEGLEVDEQGTRMRMVANVAVCKK